MNRTRLLVALSIFIFCSCNLRNSGHKIIKADNEPFFDNTFVTQGYNPYDTPEAITRMTSWIKVGQSYTFRKANYIDLLASPPQWEATSILISFNNDRTVDIRSEKVGWKTVKVKFFYTDWVAGNNLFDTDGGYYGITMYLEDNTTLEVFKQLRPGEYGNSLYGMRLDSEQYSLFTGTRTTNTLLVNPFDY